MTPSRVDYSGRGELSERQQVLGKILSRMLKIGEHYNVTSLMANQVMSDPGRNSAFDMDQRKSVDENIMAYA